MAKKLSSARKPLQRCVDPRKQKQDQQTLGCRAKMMYYNHSPSLQGMEGDKRKYIKELGFAIQPAEYTSQLNELI